MFDLTKLDNSKIIFNHIPKAGGSSLYFFFQDLFGADKVFRYKTRNVDTEIVSMEDLTQQERDQNYIFQGHFHYGYHTLFSHPILYFGIIRDPIERIISTYYYLQTKGQAKAKEYARSVSLEEYFQARLKDGGADLGSMQTKFLTGKETFEEAKQVIEKEYFLCCTTKQLDGCQRLLSQIYKKKLDAKRRNVTASDEKSGDTLQQLKNKHRDLFETDYKTLRFVRDFYNTRRDEIRSQLGIETTPVAKSKPAGQKAKPAAGGKSGPAAKKGLLAKKSPAGTATAGPVQAKAATSDGQPKKQGPAAKPGLAAKKTPAAKTGPVAKAGQAAKPGQAAKSSQPANKGPAAKVGQAKPGQGKTAQAKPGQAKPGQAKPGQAKPGQAKAAQAKPGQAKPGQAKAAQAKPGQAKPGQAKAAQAKPGQAKPGQGKAAQAKPGQAKPGQGKAAQAKPGQAKPGQAKAAQANPGQAKPGQGKAAQAKPGQAKPGQAKAAQAKPGQAKPGQGKAAQAKPGQAKAAQAMPGKAKPGQAKASPAKAGGEKAGRPNLKVVG